MEGQQASAQQAIGLALMQFLQAAQGVQGPQAPLFRVWESYGLGTAVAPQWTGPGCAGRSGGHGKGHGPQLFFKDVESVAHNWYDASDATNYNASPPSMVEVGGTISSGGRSKKSSMEEAPAGCTTNHTTQCGHKHFVNDARRGAGVCNKCSTGVQPCSTGQLKQSERREY